MNLAMPGEKQIVSWYQWCYLIFMSGRLKLKGVV